MKRRAVHTMLLKYFLRNGPDLCDAGGEQGYKAVCGCGELGGGDGRQRAVRHVLHLRAHHLDALHLRRMKASSVKV